VPLDETQRFSPKRGTALLDNLLGRNPDDPSGLELAQATLRLLEPELLRIRICFLIEAREEALRETGAVPARELQGLRFESARWVSHTRKLSRGRVTASTDRRGQHPVELALLPNGRGERRPKRVRSTALFGAYPCDLTTLRDWQHCEQLRDEAAEIGDTVRGRTQHDDSDGGTRQLLLKGKITVDRDENVELVLRSRQEFAILQRSPASVRHCLHVVALDVRREAPIDALVEKHPHDAFEIIRAVASSRKATTWSRLTVGNPAKKSSIVSPPSR